HAREEGFSTIQRNAEPHIITLVVGIITTVVPHDTENSVAVNGEHRHESIWCFAAFIVRPIVTYDERRKPRIPFITGSSKANLSATRPRVYPRCVKPVVKGTLG